MQTKGRLLPATMMIEKSTVNTLLNAEIASRMPYWCRIFAQRAVATHVRVGDFQPAYIWAAAIACFFFTDKDYLPYMPEEHKMSRFFKHYEYGKYFLIHKYIEYKKTVLHLKSVRGACGSSSVSTPGSSNATENSTSFERKFPRNFSIQRLTVTRVGFSTQWLSILAKSNMVL